MARAARVLKFLAAGALGAGVNVAVAVLAERAGMPYLGAAALGYLAGFLAHFAAQRAVYGAKGDSLGRAQMAGFGLLAVENVSLTVLAAFAGVEVLRLPLFAPQAAVIVLLAAQNYWLYPRLVFRRGSSGEHLPPRLWPCLAAALLALWLVAHVPAMRYGTASLPLHQSHVGDEQSPVNAALHVLQARSPLALRNDPNLYYGPVFGMLAVPAVIADYASGAWAGLGTSAESFRDRILFDWGGTVRAARLIALLASAAALVFAFVAFRSGSLLNPYRARWLPYVAAGLLASNFYLFEYGAFFKHWPFVLAAALADLACASWISVESDARRRRGLWALATAAALVSFGVSYFAGLYRIVYLPLVLLWAARREWLRVREFFGWGVGYLAGCALVLWWHPYAFLRLLDGQAFVSGGGEEDIGASWAYYARLLLENHVGLVAALVATAAALVALRTWRGEATSRAAALAALALPAVASFALFAAEPRHEGRYMLPVIVFGILALAYLAGSVPWDDSRLKRTRAVALAGAVAYAVLHVASIAAWSVSISRGPAEERFVADLRAKIAAGELAADARVLVAQDYLVGAMHTKEAYAAYLAALKPGQSINLYDAILAADLPASPAPIDFRYLTPPGYADGDVTPEDKIAARHFFAAPPAPEAAASSTVAYWRLRPRVEVNQFDFFDESLPRVFFRDALLDVYVPVPVSVSAAGR